MEVARHWRTQRARYRLEGARCSQCERVHFPPRDRCQVCGGGTVAHVLRGHGTVYSYTIVRHPPVDFRGQAPYVVALVQLQEGPLVTAQLTDVDAREVTVGMPLEMVVRRLREDGAHGLVLYAYKFRPVLLPEV